MSGPEFDPRALAAMIDHTILRPDATEAQVRRCCDEALLHGFDKRLVEPVLPRVHAPVQVGDRVRVAVMQRPADLDVFDDGVRFHRPLGSDDS